MAPKKSSNDEEEAAVLAIFQQGDANGNGVLELDEFIQIMKALDSSLTDADITKMRDAADANRDGTVCIDEFVHWVFQAQSCGGAAHVKKVVHGCLHAGHPDAFNDEELSMYWNQAKKVKKDMPADFTPDEFVSEMQMVNFILRITNNEEGIDGEVREMWHEPGYFPFAKGPAAKKAIQARGLDEEDDAVLDKAGFFKVIGILDQEVL